jgi:hypothetical protein
MYSGKIAVPLGGGGKVEKKFFLQTSVKYDIILLDR